MACHPKSKLLTSSWTTRLATATGALAAVALSPSAGKTAVIHVTGRPVSLTWPTGTQAFWDVDGDSTNDFRLWKDRFTASSRAYTYLVLSSNPNGRGIVGTGSGGKVNNLPLDFVLGPTLAAYYTWKPRTNNRTAVGDSGSIGGFNGFVYGFNEEDNIFGFRFADSANPTDLYYGWATLNFSPLANGQRTVTISSWAYNSTPNASIRVGQTQDNPAAVPGPIGLAGLAAGAAWTRKLRKRIKSAA